jgi:hypothetical protein
MEGLQYYKSVSKGLSLVRNQSVGVDYSELKPLERIEFSIKGEACKREEVMLN